MATSVERDGVTLQQMRSSQQEADIQLTHNNLTRERFFDKGDAVKAVLREHDSDVSDVGTIPV